MDTPPCREPLTERIYTAAFYSLILLYFAKIPVFITIFHQGGQRFPWNWRSGIENEESGAGMGSFWDGGDTVPAGAWGIRGHTPFPATLSWHPRNGPAVVRALLRFPTTQTAPVGACDGARRALRLPPDILQTELQLALYGRAVLSSGNASSTRRHDPLAMIRVAWGTRRFRATLPKKTLPSIVPVDRNGQ